MTTDTADLLRRLEIVELALFGHSGNHWQEIYEKDGWLFGCLESTTYLLDPQTKRPVSRGYQSVHYESSGVFIGTTGVLVETFRVPTSFQCEFVLQVSGGAAAVSREAASR